MAAQECRERGGEERVREPARVEHDGYPAAAAGIGYSDGHYVITNRRVLSVVQRLRAETIETLPLHEIVSISTHSGAAARGSVEFGLPSPYRDTGIEFLENGNVERAGVRFSDISDPDTVADLVEHLRDQGRS